MGLFGLPACGGGAEKLGPYTSPQVAKAFAAATGDALTSTPGESLASYEVLKLNESGDSLRSYDRYGVFSIYILNKEQARDIVYRRDSETKKPIKPASDGIYWRCSIGDRSYESDSAAEFDVQPRRFDAYPIQPDQTTPLAAVFDVPPAAAAQVSAAGALAISGDERGSGSSSVPNAKTVGRIRLNQ